MISLRADKTASGEASESPGGRDALIRRISWAIHNSHNPEEVLQTVVNELGEALGVCRCRLGLITASLADEIPISHEYTSPCCANRPKMPPCITLPGNPAMQILLASEEPIAVNDVTQTAALIYQQEDDFVSGVRSMMAATIRLGDKPIGVFSLHRCHPYNWTADEIEIVKTISRQAALAIRQAELFHEATEAALRANLINQILVAIRRSLNIDDILQVAAEQLGVALSANRVYFQKFVNGMGQMVASYATNEPVNLPAISLAGAKAIMERIRESRQLLVINDFPGFLEEQGSEVGAILGSLSPPNLSQIVQPIFVDDTFWGVLSIGQTDYRRKWAKGEISLVETVSAQIEIAIRHSELFAEAKQATKVESLVRRITQSINQANYHEEIYRVVAVQLGNFLNADAIAISALNESTGEWAVQCAYSNGEAYKPARANFQAELFVGLRSALRDGFIICNDVENDPFAAPYLDSVLRPAGIRAILGNVLFYQGRPKLSIVAMSKSAPHVWTNQEINILRAAADQMLIGYERIKIFEYVARGKMEWEATFDALADGLLIFDRHGILRRVNESGILLEGSTMQQMLGQKCCELLQGIEDSGCKVTEVLKTGKSLTFELIPDKFGKPVLVTISPLTRRASESFDSAFSNSARAENQEIQGAVCIVRDLSELRAAEAEARQQRNFLVKLIEHATDVIMALAPYGRLVWFNERLLNLSGYSRAELSGTGYQKFIAPAEKEKALMHFQKALTGEIQNSEIAVVTQAGQERLMLITWTPIFDEGAISNVLLIARDITEEKMESERASQSEKMRALGQLSAGIAHNFNNLLAAILGHAQLIKRGVKEERLAKQAAVIERAALDGAEMVKRIQAFGNQQKDEGYESFDMNRLIHESIILTRTRWQSEGQAQGLNYEVLTDLQNVPMARGSSSEIKEVFVNLILNALDAMPGGGTLKISSLLKDDFVQVKFADSGIGISPKVMEHLFEPFFTTKGVSGTGLGLAISYSTIERHGGSIEVSSSLGKGSTFSILLPAEIKKAVAQQVLERGLEPKAHHALRILVVDDDALVRNVLVDMLKELEHEVAEAGNGAEAFERLEQETFDVVFTDLSMPDLDGLAVAGEIRRRWQKMKIVLLTGYGSPIESSHRQRGVLDAVLSKPVRLDELNLIIHQLTDGALH